jgi:NAD(P)-dependent dehydrogenase (short-subunit alcohol dehydrogenase family)
MQRIKLIKNQLSSTPMEIGQKIWVTKPIDQLVFTKENSLKGKTIFITGASRGIGLAIALRAARDGANITIAAKTVTEQKTLEGTIYTAAEQIRKAGGNALPIQCDIRNEESVKKAVELTVEKFGGIDILINNASAINLSCTEELDMKRYDLMQNINARGTFLCSKYCLPYLKKSTNAHILTISPDIKEITKSQWFKDHVAYSTAKFGMSLCTLGMAEEFKQKGYNNIGVNCLWPKTVIATAAANNVLGGDSLMRVGRLPSIMADAAYVIITSKSSKTTGNYFYDDEVLLSSGLTSADLLKYNYDKSVPQSDLAIDFFISVN